MIEFGNILRKAGLTVVEEPGWRTRGHPGTFAPVGGVWHHTGGLNALGVVMTTGRPDLAPPLCNLYLDREGVWHVVAAGLAYHAGPGSAKVLADLRVGIAPKGFAVDLKLVDDGSANGFTVGVEVEAKGDGSSYPIGQVRALVVGSAALCRELGWTANHWVHHREWTARKVDMDLASTLDLRALVAAELAPPASTGTTEGDDMQKILVIDAPGRPKALMNDTASPGEHLARIFSPGEWTAFWRAYALGTDETGKPTGQVGWRYPDVQIVIENRPAEEFDTLTGFQS